MNDQEKTSRPAFNATDIVRAPPGHAPDPKPAKLLILAGVYVAIVVLGFQLGSWIGEQFEFDFYLSPRTEPAAHRMLLLAVAAYVALMATPFVPGIEIGLALMVLFGREICLLVYLSTVLALNLSFLIGRLIPEALLLWTLQRLRLRRAHALVSRLHSLRPDERLQFLLESASSRAFPRLLRYRYVAIVVALNVPGNAIIGGGGGIALAAGLSRLFSFPTYFLTVCIAVAPVPLAVALTGVMG